MKHQKKIQTELEELKRNLNLLIEPKAIMKTNLFRLLEMKRDFLLWPLIECGGKEFEYRWDELIKTEQFESLMAGAMVW